MAVSTRTSAFNPAETSVVVAGNTLTGFAEGTFVEIARAEDTFTDVVGANGEVTRIKRNNLSATITITLLQGSESNLVLSNLHNIDENTGIGVFVVNITDNSGGSTYKGAKAWVQKTSDVTFSSAHESRAWTIKVAQLIMSTAGNTTL